MGFIIGNQKEQINIKGGNEMARTVKSKSSSKTYIWRVNPDTSKTKYSHKKYDGATRKSTRKI